MKVGFTGTRSGMSRHQFREFRKKLKVLQRDGVTELHHGDCLGADVQAHRLALSLGIKVVIHPPTNSTNRAYCRGAKKVLEDKEYLERNHDIVDACDVLFVAPFTNTEQMRSGTWATFRYAKKIGREIIKLKR
ncbi:hypothetical protein KAR91_02510 [Candidatus Pacearchaeota archaeon]|nr:hypothetical protein [Candidatus Pacearchaeota archaeon]